ncbi:hypothetical protein P692DRAFT_20876874 [Suillus brevipes Sb2]|nr:hypothetical protein P692DRAFT_20876874 [Suillus brevipes Sb2]
MANLVEGPCFRYLSRIMEPHHSSSLLSELFSSSVSYPILQTLFPIPIVTILSIVPAILQ